MIRALGVFAVAAWVIATVLCWRVVAAEQRIDQLEQRPAPAPTVTVVVRVIPPPAASRSRRLGHGLRPARTATPVPHRTPRLAQTPPPRRSAPHHRTPQLNWPALAECESGGDPTAVNPSGRYRGAFQFDLSTWANYGAAGDPAAAPYDEQLRRAQALYADRGGSPWPECQKYLR